MTVFEKAACIFVVNPLIVGRADEMTGHPPVHTPMI